MVNNKRTKASGPIVGTSDDKILSLQKVITRKHKLTEEGQMSAPQWLSESKQIRSRSGKSLSPVRTKVVEGRKGV